MDYWLAQAVVATGPPRDAANKHRRALVEPWENGLSEKGVSLAYLPSPGQVKMRLGVNGPASDREKLEALIASETETLVKLIAPHVVGRGNMDIPEMLLQTRTGID